MRHTIKKFKSTLGICARIIMARTFGEYIHSGYNGQCHYARYKWRGYEYYIQTQPEVVPETMLQAINKLHRTDPDNNCKECYGFGLVHRQRFGVGVTLACRCLRRTR